MTTKDCHWLQRTNDWFVFSDIFGKGDVHEVSPVNL
jgi:hypothetical protein